MIGPCPRGVIHWGQLREFSAPASTPRIPVPARDPAVIHMFHSLYYYGFNKLISRGSIKMRSQDRKKGHPL